jgi:hypothetical protein
MVAGVSPVARRLRKSGWDGWESPSQHRFAFTFASVAESIDMRDDIFRNLKILTPVLKTMIALSIAQQRKIDATGSRST